MNAVDISSKPSPASGCVFVLSTTSHCIVTKDAELKIPKIILGDKNNEGPTRSYLVTIKPPNYKPPDINEKLISQQKTVSDNNVTENNTVQSLDQTITTNQIIENDTMQGLPQTIVNDQINDNGTRTENNITQSLGHVVSNDLSFELHESNNSPDHDYDDQDFTDDFITGNTMAPISSTTNTPTLPQSMPKNSVPSYSTSFNENKSSVETSRKIADIKSLLELNDKINKGETESSTKNTKSSKKKESPKNKYKCKQCSFTSDNKEDCIQHSLDVHEYKDPETNHQCQYCDYNTFGYKYLKRHLSLKHPFTKPNTCHLCDFSCIQKGLLTRHLILQHNYSLLECKKCDFKCDSLMALIEHRKTHTNAIPQQCQYCAHECASVSGLKVHMKKKHPDVYDDNYVYDDIPLPENTNGYTCRHCNELFQERNQLADHMKTRHEIDNVLFCKYCNYTTQKKGTFYLHVQTKHSQVKPYICKICDFQTRSKQSFLLHNRSVHLKLKPYRCNGHGCSFKGATKTHLTRHIAAIHINYKPNTCEYCPYSTAQRSNLQQHMLKVHSVHLEPSTRGGFLHKDKVLEELVNKFQSENQARPSAPSTPVPQQMNLTSQHNVVQQNTLSPTTLSLQPTMSQTTHITNMAQLDSNDRYLQL